MTPRWFILTLIGQDQPGIVARVSQALFEGGCHLGEASMTRLGETFSIMLMVGHEGDARHLEKLLEPVVQALDLKAHLDPVARKPHPHPEPDVLITVFGADRPGIVAQVTGALARAGLNILDLTSEVGGTEEKGIYIMRIEGQAQKGIEPLEKALEEAKKQGVEAHLQPIDTLIA